MVLYIMYFCANEIMGLICAVWRYHMKVCYDKLWRLMKDNKMKKSDLSKAAEISSYAMTKLNNDRPVSMEVKLRLSLRRKSVSRLLTGDSNCRSSRH